jgi:ABC-type amino acid transport substrate-binding protein
LTKFRLYILIILVLLNTPLYPSQNYIKVSYDPDYAPFSYIENNKPEGLLIDIWKLWASKNDYKINFVNGNSRNNAIKLVLSNKVDFFLGTTPYKKWMKASTKIYEKQTSLYILKNHSKSFSKDASYIIGIVGKDFEKSIKLLFPNSEVIEYENYSSIFADLESRKIDLVYDDKMAVEFSTLRNNFFHKTKSINLVKEKREIKVISKKQKLIDTFDKGFENITNEELYDIENKWVLMNLYSFIKIIK